MSLQLKGHARRFGDDINSDYIIASARKKETLDGAVLKRYLFETLDPAFAASVRPGDLLVAGRNFGCGSAMEVAVTVIQAARISAVVAASFSRSFYRNAINNGLLVVECDTEGIAENDPVSISIEAGVPKVHNGRDGIVRPGQSLPRIMQEILAEGGLAPYLRKHGRFVSDARRASRG